jgi:hypothetical protein
MHKPAKFDRGFTYANDRIEDGAIVDGLWKDYISEYNNVFPDMSYAYGYLRAPWNLNPSPYVSRFTFNLTSYKMPSCSDHYNLLQFESMMVIGFSSLASFDPSLTLLSSWLLSRPSSTWASSRRMDTCTS